MRWAFYSLIRRGWMRSIGKLSADIQIQIGDYRRKFEYWSGRPYWQHVQNSRDTNYVHPSGCMRMYDAAEKRWYWANQDRTAILDPDGLTLWDTVITN